jgi:beta-glucosidase
VLRKEEFMLGAATSAHQTEGNNVNSDCWLLEHMGNSSYHEPSGMAADHYNRFREDIAGMKNAGMNAYRFSMEWARIEPEKGRFDDKEVMHYKEVIDCCRQNGIEPVVTMHHFSSPLWLGREGGWECEKVPEYFSRYCSYIAEKLGSAMHYVCTINEANMRLQLASLMESYMASMHMDVQVGVDCQKSEEKQNQVNTFLSPCSGQGELLIMKAHEQARDAMKKICPELRIGLTLSLHDCQAAGDGKEKAKAKWTEEFVHYLPWLQKDDFIGVQNYTRAVFDENGEVPVPENAPKTQMGYEVYPEALEHVIRAVAGDWKKEILVTENGIATADDGERISFIKKALNGVHHCRQDGIPVNGYLYWSLLDNFEWQMGYSRTFGLIAVNRQTMEREEKKSLFFPAEEWKRLEHN